MKLVQEIKTKMESRNRSKNSEVLNFVLEKLKNIISS